MKTNCDFALEYAAQGLKVFPVHEPRDDGCSCNNPECDSPAKHPRTKNGFLDASSDPETIAEWFRKTPTANIGCVTGIQPSGAYLIVVDVDGAEGSESIRGLLSDEQRKTATVLTGRGEHLWYYSASLFDCNVGFLGRKIDVRGRGGYVLMPPSRHISGRRYEWEVEYSLDDIFPLWLPEKISKMLADKEANKKTAIVAVTASTGMILEGTRNDTLFRLGCSMQSRGFLPETIKLAIHNENEIRCERPLTKASVDNIIKGIFSRYAPGLTGVLTDFNDLNSVSSGLVSIDAADLLARPYLPPEFIVEGLLPKVGSGVLSGDTGCGKTSLVINAALSIAADLPIAGRFQTKASGPVIYLSAEMGTVTYESFVRANLRGLGVSTIPRGRLIMQGSDAVADWYAPRGSPQILARQQLRQFLQQHQLSFVVFDTFRAFFECDENSSEGVRSIFSWLHNMAEEFKCFILVLHHLRKLSAGLNSPRERVAGSRDIIAAVDVHLAVKAPSGRPMTSLLLDKTRTPSQGIAAGTEWPVQAIWEDGEQPLSRFIIDSERQPKNLSSLERATEEMLCQLLRQGPCTVKDLKADGGSAKRAFDKLRAEGRIAKQGHRGQAELWGQAVHIEGEDEA